MPGRSAMRWSIVGVAVKVVTRWRSMTSTTRAASNFSITTSRSPASRLLSVTNAVDVVHRREHEDRLRPGHRTPHASAIGRAASRGRRPAGRSSEDHLRRARRSAAADAVHVRRDHVGQVGHRSVGGRVDPRQVVRAQVDPRRRSPPAAARAPSRARPSAPAPAPRRASRPRRRARTNCGRVAEAQPDAVAELDAHFGQFRRHLARAPVHLRPRHRGLGAVDGEMDVREVVRPFLRQLADASDVADRFFDLHRFRSCVSRHRERTYQ